eukprot:m.302744 g.302744  ORF g.302744 m.302744 type:complete len:93 (-) comp55240_c3_seq26:706-984(-)
MVAFTVSVTILVAMIPANPYPPIFVKFFNNSSLALSILFVPFPSRTPNDTSTEPVQNHVENTNKTHRTPQSSEKERTSEEEMKKSRSRFEQS